MFVDVAKNLERFHRFCRFRAIRVTVKTYPIASRTEFVWLVFELRCGTFGQETSDPIETIRVQFMDIGGLRLFWMRFATMFDKREDIDVGLVAERALNREVIDMKFEMILAFRISVEVLLLAEEARNNSRLLNIS